MSNTSTLFPWWPKKREKIDSKLDPKLGPKLNPRFGDPHYDPDGNPLPPPGHFMHPGSRNR